MSSEQQTAETMNAAGHTTSAIGATLRAERERQGLSIEDMAARIKFAPRQLLALEADDFAALPEGAFLRGLVRSYARSLHLDESPLLAGLQTPVAAHGDVSAVQAGGAEFPHVSRTMRLNRYLYAAAAILVVLGVLWAGSRTPVVEQAVVVQDIALTPEQPVSAVTAVVAPASAIAAPKSDAPPPAAASEAPVPARLTVVPVPAAPVEKTVLTDERLRKRPIHIVFDGDSWMEIKDVNGEVLLSRMNAAGSEKWIGGNRRAPYQIAIGRPDAVKMFYRGREINLSQYQAASGVVRFTLE